MEKLDQLKEKVREITYLGRAAAVLGWDQQTYMPSGGAEDRGNQLAVLGSLTHRMFTSPEMGQLIEDCKPIVASMDPDSDDACLVRMLDKNYKKNTRVPTEHVAEFAQVTTLAQETWARARAASDFAAFRPYLERIVELRRQYASFFAPYDHVYDPLLDDFEPGLKTGDVQAIFGALRPQQVEIIQAITARPQVDDAFLHRTYPEQGQWDFGVDVITRFGYDWNRGRQDKSAHPFTTSFGIGDVRITTRFDPERSASALFSTMHECGHALYEQGIDPILAGLPLADGASMAIHESQSRMWENLVGRSLPFWTFFFPRFKERFPAQREGVDLQNVYRGINKVEPSLIRVEADEATYNLHIMLRLELEIALMEGSLEVKDLPEAWNAAYLENLGIAPENDADGCMQDVHWFGGTIGGAFQGYTLGNILSAQFFEEARKALPGIHDDMRRGSFAGLHGWLRENIYRHGSKFTAPELIERVTGRGLDIGPYIRYLREKYGKL